MGRIETEGLTLVDLEETKELLGKSRATIFRLIKKSDLIQIHVRGNRIVHVTLESIERYQRGAVRNTLEFLELTYGADWRTPIKDFHHGWKVFQIGENGS